MSAKTAMVILAEKQADILCVLYKYNLPINVRKTAKYNQNQYKNIADYKVYRQKHA